MATDLHFDELMRAPELVAKLSPSERRQIILRCAALIASASTPEPENPATRDDRLLTAEEAAPIMGLSPEWLTRKARTLGFARRCGRFWRFSEAGVREYSLKV